MVSVGRGGAGKESARERDLRERKVSSLLPPPQALQKVTTTVLSSPLVISVHDHRKRRPLKISRNLLSMTSSSFQQDYHIWRTM